MKRYRLYINGQPTQQTAPITERRLPWQPNWQWLEYEHTPVWCMTRATRCNGEVLPFRSPTAYLKHYKKHIRQPRGMQLLNQAMRQAA